MHAHIFDIALQVTIEPMKAEGSVVIKVDENFYVKLMIWDTVGMERLFNTIPDKWGYTPCNNISPNIIVCQLCNNDYMTHYKNCFSLSCFLFCGIYNGGRYRPLFPHVTWHNTCIPDRRLSVSTAVLLHIYNNTKPCRLVYHNNNGIHMLLYYNNSM